MRILLIIMLSLIPLFANIKLNGYYHNNKEAKHFINYMIRKHNFKRSYLIDLFCRASKPHEFKVKRRKRKIITGYAKGVKWWLRNTGFSHHEKVYLNKDRIIQGAKFVKRYKSIFERIEKQLKVDKFIVAAVIGIETYYGDYKGSWESFNLLAYRAFKGKNRKRYFRYELEHLLMLSYRQHLKALWLKGSKFGALGLGQLMPDSYIKYGVSFDGNKRIEPFSKPDAIATVANYLHKKGWHYGQKVAIRARFKGRHFHRNFRSKRLYSINYIKKLGISPREKIKSKYCYVIKLKRAEFDEIWLGFNNYEVIKRYNNSDKYAMAVYKLANAIKEYYKRRYK